MMNPLESDQKVYLMLVGGYRFLSQTMEGEIERDMKKKEHKKSNLRGGVSTRKM